MLGSRSGSIHLRLPHLAGCGELFGAWRLHNLRQIIMHVIAETACHAGHLDAVRELIDGRTWMILT